MFLYQSRWATVKQKLPEDFPASKVVKEQIQAHFNVSPVLSKKEEANTILSNAKVPKPLQKYVKEFNQSLEKTNSPVLNAEQQNFLYKILAAVLYNQLTSSKEKMDEYLKSNGDQGAKHLLWFSTANFALENDVKLDDALAGVTNKDDLETSYWKIRGNFAKIGGEDVKQVSEINCQPA